jgi:hypothetical protein
LASRLDFGDDGLHEASEMRLNGDVVAVSDPVEIRARAHPATDDNGTLRVVEVHGGIDHSEREVVAGVWAGRLAVVLEGGLTGQVTEVLARVKAVVRMGRNFDRHLAKALGLVVRIDEDAAAGCGCNRKVGGDGRGASRGCGPFARR